MEPGGTEDPIVPELRDSPVRGADWLPGPALGSFLAGASVVRREAFLAVGGFSERLWLGGEEELMAGDLAAAGWELCYLPALTVHHQASRARDPHRRRRDGIRNTLWTTWLRRPVRPALRRTLALLRSVPRDRVTARGLFEAVGGIPWGDRRRAGGRRRAVRRCRAELEPVRGRDLAGGIERPGDRRGRRRDGCRDAGDRAAGGRVGARSGQRRRRQRQQREHGDEQRSSAPHGRYPRGTVRVYCDHAATTPLCDEAWRAMEPFLRERFGNPSEPHAEGRAARAGLDAARARAAEALGVRELDVLFTGGGSEADNLAVLGRLARVGASSRRRSSILPSPAR